MARKFNKPHPVLKNSVPLTVWDAIDRLSAKDKKVLAKEIEPRVYQLWLAAELEKGERSGGMIPAEVVFDRLERKLKRLERAQKKPVKKR